MFAAKVTIDYLTNLILGPGQSFEIRAFDSSILPLWVGRVVSIAELYTQKGLRFLIVFPEATLTADRFIFICHQLKQKTQIPAILVADRLPPQVRAALTRERCQTVITGRQLFAPELGISLKTKEEDSLKLIEANKWKEQESELSKTARQVLVAILLNKHLQNEQMSLSTFAEVLRKWIFPSEDSDVIITILSYLSRAVTQLEDLQLLKTTRIGRERKIQFNNPNDLWSGLCRFTNITVTETAIIPQDLLKNDIVYSGESALSFYSNLTAPTIPICALTSHKFNELKRYRRLSSQTPEDHGEIKIEHWKADPYFLWEKRNVNPIDLALSLRLEKDERIRIALTEVLKKYGLPAEPLWSF